MFSVHSAKVYLAREPVDLRKSIDGLSILVSQVLREDPFSEQLFVFINRRGDKIKLQWLLSGLAIEQRRALPAVAASAIA